MNRRQLPVTAVNRKVVAEDVAVLTSGARSAAEELGYKYAEIERGHRYRFLFEPFRLLEQQDRIAAYAAGEDPFPASVEFDPANSCNHHCEFCIYSSLHSKGRSERIDDGRLLELVEELAQLGVSSALFVGGGEPMTHPRTVDAIELAAAKGMSVGLVTNGSRVFPELGVRLRRSATYVRFSLDAADAEIHRRLHGNDDHHRIVRNLRALAEADGPCTVGTGYFINDGNVDDLVAAGRLVKDCGAQYIQYKSYSGVAIEPGLHQRMLAELGRALELDDDTFDVHIVRRIFDNNVHQVRGYTRCHWQQFKPVIGADGNVFLCAQKRTRTDAGPGIAGVIGNVYENTFAEIWRGEQRRKVLAELELKSCPFCVHHQQNELLEYVAEFSAPHGTFY
ncbi:radical SAM protein [Streptomyces acidiscabies]|uniref:radical SAM protein n=1 Tax=Streptomyces acidiscabies TaxID=42234 RepID=UPI0009624AB9|nr:radical SAM protein [Streptomyces acidiscabies]GAV38291.1 molybdenum cofactor biosynthesis protein A [Streptomyces acidiscabies]